MDNYQTPNKELGDTNYGQKTKCFAAAVVQMSPEMGSMQGVRDTRNDEPHILKYEIYESDAFSSKMVSGRRKGLDLKDFIQADGTVRCISFVPLGLFKNWYFIDPQVSCTLVSAAVAICTEIDLLVE